MVLSRIKKKWIWVLVACVMLLVSGQNAEAASTKNTTGLCEYDKAYEVLEKVNEKRVAAGKSKLSMDKDLLEAAMLRAAELTVEFNHIRPNGEDCFTACDKMYAENIAMGQSSSGAVMESWMASGGHRTNILEGSYKSIGIGCFYKDGVRYWAQCFGYEKATSVAQPTNVERTYKVSLTGGTETTIVSAETPEEEGGDDKNAEVTPPAKVSNFKITAGKKNLTLKWKKQAGIDGYQIQISTGKSFKNKTTYMVGKNKTKKTITKYKGKRLKAKKKYYVRICAYVNVTNEDGTVTKKYGKWNTKTKKTK